jgi:hypothetical protein
MPYHYIKRDTEVIIKKSRGVLPTRPKDEQVILRGLNDQLWDLLMSCWIAEPAQRPTISHVLERLDEARC